MLILLEADGAKQIAAAVGKEDLTDECHLEEDTHIGPGK